jgi:2-desacetyl-2-hydroxyethyl bacteriochlorophyllide A dehydrogenase
MIRAKRISFPEPNRAELEEFELDERLEGAQLLLATECSVISAGTEGAAFTGLELEHPGRAATWGYPRLTTGYANLGRVLALGPDAKELAVGDRVLTFSPHASHWKWDSVSFALRVPPEAEGRRAVFTRMAGVAITALRKSSLRAGDPVAVVGLGLVGNFAAQLFQLAGAQVIGLDRSESRLQRARACGLDRLIDVSQEDPVAAVLERTGGRGARVVVEAIGRSDLIAQAVQFTRRHGEVILLGSPRARATFDVTPMLSRIHLQGIRLIGALEWLYPRREVEGDPVTLHENYRQILGWIMEERIAVEPLRTHLLSPAACQQAYAGLAREPDEYLGVVFDWSAA